MNIRLPAVISGLTIFFAIVETAQSGPVAAKTKHQHLLPLSDEKAPSNEAIKRSKRYSLQPVIWPNKNLTYKILSYPKSLTEPEVQFEIAKAFAVWSKFTDLTFKLGNRDDTVDIEISFTEGNHDDGLPFDGVGGNLAHAFPVLLGGAIHLDAAENWTVGRSDGISLFRVAVHEIGHSLGLGHSTVSDAVMAPYILDSLPNSVIHSDDITGIRALYAKKSDNA